MRISHGKALGMLCLLTLLSSLGAGLQLSGRSPILRTQSVIGDPAFTVTGAFWGVPNGGPIEAGPGQQNVPLTISLFYNASERLLSLNGTVNLPQGFTDTNGRPAVSATEYFQALPSPTLTSLTCYLDIAPSAPLKTYSLSLSLTWNTTSTINQTEQTSTTIKLSGEVKLNFNATQTALSPGQTNNITLNLSNLGTGTASQITTSPIAPPSTSILNQLPTISSLNPSSTTQLHLQLYVPAALTGVAVTVSLTSDYTDAYGNARIYTQTLGFYVTSINQFSSPLAISIQPAVLIAGQVTGLTVLISNQGTTDLTSLTASFSFPFASQATWLSPDIARNSSLAASQTMLVSASAYEPPTTLTSLSLQIALTYYDNLGIFHQEVRSLGLLSRGIVSLQATDIAVTPEQPYPGEVFSITITLTNTGTTIASAVTANATTPSAITTFGSSSVFIGDMPTSSPTPFTITFTVGNDTTPGTYQIPIKLSFRDNLRTNLTSSLQVPVTVVLPNSTGGSTAETRRVFGLEIILGVAVVVGLAMFGTGFWAGRRRSGKQ